MPAPHSGLFFGWRIVAAAFLIYFMSGGLFTTATVFFKALTTEFGWSRGELSGVFSLGFLVAGVSAPIWGRVADRRGPRASFLPGVVITGCLCILLSRVFNLASLYGLYLVFTFGSAGISLIPISVLLSNWFVRKRGRAIGVAYTGIGFGSLILTPVIGYLVTTVGWRSTYVLCGVAVLVVLTPVVLWITNRPSDLGLSPDGIDAPAVPATPASHPVLDQVSGGFSLVEAVRTPAFWMVAAAWLTTLMPLTAVGLHQVPYMTDLGLSTESAALVAGGVGGMSIIGRVGLGLLSERYPIGRIYASCYLLAAVGIAALWAATPLGPSALGLYIVAYGIAVGGSFALTALLVGDLFGGRALGEIFGLLGLAATIGGAIGGTGAGFLFDFTGSYDTVFALSVAATMAGALLMALVRRPPPAAAGVP